jgi:hypothetical protein
VIVFGLYLKRWYDASAHINKCPALDNLLALTHKYHSFILLHDLDLVLSILHVFDIKLRNLNDLLLDVNLGPLPPIKNHRMLELIMVISLHHYLTSKAPERFHRLCGDHGRRRRHHLGLPDDFFIYRLFKH